MGLSRRLGAGESSFETMGTPGGSSGWQAPEQLVGHQGEQVKQSKAMDVFSCGILLFYVLTGRWSGGGGWGVGGRRGMVVVRSTCLGRWGGMCACVSRVDMPHICINTHISHTHVYPIHTCIPHNPYPPNPHTQVAVTPLVQHLNVTTTYSVVNPTSQPSPIGQRRSTL